MRLDTAWPLVLAVAIGVLAATRLVRLIVDDDWPPIMRARDRYVNRVSAEWAPLVECPWCVGVYVALPATLWFASLVAWPGATWNLYLWWICNGWMALAWAVAWLNLRDLPPEARD